MEKQDKKGCKKERKRKMRKWYFMLGFMFLLMTGRVSVQAQTTDTWANHAAEYFSTGNGTESDPYLISTAAELALVAKHANEEVETGKYYELAADIDLKGYEWVPIGNNSKADMGFAVSYENVFSGYFDGNHYTIYNMSIENAVEGVCYYGLFGVFNDGVIKNVNLENVKIDINSVEEGWQADNGMGSEIYVGGICGDMSGSDYDKKNPTISNCNVSNADIDVVTAMSVSVGGLSGGVNYASAKNCMVEADISVTSGRALFVGGAFGGISNYTTILNCQSDCQVETVSDGTIANEELDGEGYGYCHYAGGFAGCAGRANANVTIRDCYAEGTLNAKMNKMSPDGGMFAGNCGVVHGTSIYENLVTSVVVYNNGVRENYFNKAEGTGYYPNIYEESVCSHNNLITIYDNKATVYSYHGDSSWESIMNDRKCVEYDLADTTLNDILKESEMSEDVWCMETDATGLCLYVGKVEKAGTSDVHKQYTCVTCGDTYTEKFEEKHTHTVVVDPMVKPEVGKEGKTEGKHCSTCGAILVPQNAIPALSNKDDGMTGDSGTTGGSGITGDTGATGGSGITGDTGTTEGSGTTENTGETEVLKLTGLAAATDGNWYLYENGVVNRNYYGLYCDSNYGWWLVENGRVAFDYTGLYNDVNCGWWLVGEGRVCFEYNGLWGDSQYGWWLVSGGMVDFGYTGLYNDVNCGWWLVGGGRVCFEYNGLWGDSQYGWWLVEGGTVNFGYTGLYCDANVGWWLVGSGRVCFEYNDLWGDPQYGWWLVEGGTPSFGFTGLVQYAGNWWYVENGALNFGFTGQVNANGGTYNVVNGCVAF